MYIEVSESRPLHFPLNMRCSALLFGAGARASGCKSQKAGCTPWGPKDPARGYGYFGPYMTPCAICMRCRSTAPFFRDGSGYCIGGLNSSPYIMVPYSSAVDSIRFFKHLRSDIGSCSGSLTYGGFPKMKGPVLRVPVRRTVVYLAIYRAPPFMETPISEQQIGSRRLELPRSD